MRYLFSQNALAEFRSLPLHEFLVAFDFDGTLAPIVDDPAKARAGGVLTSDLRRLGRTLPVAVISGRGLRDLRARLDFRPEYLVGNHGLEGLRRYERKAIRAKRVCAEWVRRLESEWGALAEEPGVFIEDKIYSLSLHYKLARGKTRVARELERRIAGLKPAPRVVTGKDLFNLVPAGSPNKGDALLELMRIEKRRYAIFIGDDDTDEDVFRLAGPRLIGVRVGKKSRSRAQYFVRERREVDKLVRLFLRSI